MRALKDFLFDVPGIMIVFFVLISAPVGFGACHDAKKRNECHRAGGHIVDENCHEKASTNCTYTDYKTGMCYAYSTTYTTVCDEVCVSAAGGRVEID